MEQGSGDLELDYVRDVSMLSHESLIRFYEVLAHNLTVCVRAIWSDEELDDAQKIEQLKWINEIMHRVVLKSAALRTNRNERSELDTWKMMEGYIELCPALAPHIAFATKLSYQSVTHVRTH